MNVNPINENNTIIHIDGVYQQKSSYTVNGTQLSFGSGNIPANNTVIEVATFTQTEINVPVNDTIDTVHIKDDAVTSAKLGGNLTMPGNISFANNGKAIFGASSNLEIYYDGNHSYIKEGASGNLKIGGTNLHLMNGALTEYYFAANENGAAYLYYDNAQKLETASGGVTVTGTLTATTLAGTLSTAAQTNITSLGTLTGLNVTGANTNNFATSSGGTPTTIQITGTDAYNSGYAGAGIRFGGKYHSNGNTATLAGISGIKENTTDTQYGGVLTFFTRADGSGAGSTERMRIDSSGKVGIGTQTPASYDTNSGGISADLVVANSGHSGIIVISGTSSDAGIFFGDGTGNAAYRGAVSYVNSQDRLYFKASGANYLTLDNTKLNAMGINLDVGVDTATVNFTDSVSNGNTKYIEIGANGSSSLGDALLVTHSSGSGVGYFGYESGNDRLIIACDNGGGNNTIEFSVNAGTATGGSTDNLNGATAALTIGGDEVVTTAKHVRQSGAPGFKVKDHGFTKATGWTHIGASITTVDYNNNSSGWSSSNGRFTPTRAGYYLFSFGGWANAKKIENYKTKLMALQKSTQRKISNATIET